MSTVAETVIRKCGGAQAVADLLRIDVSSVHKWKYPKDRGGTNGLIPAARAQELLELARVAGTDLTPSDFFPVSVQPDAGSSDCKRACA